MAFETLDSVNFKNKLWYRNWQLPSILESKNWYISRKVNSQMGSEKCPAKTRISYLWESQRITVKFTQEISFMVFNIAFIITTV